MSASGRMNVGPSDAIRCALGLLLPSWFYVVALITGLAAACGAWSSTANTAAAFAGFAFAAGVEILRRIVLLSRPNGGRTATAVLRIIAGGLPILAVASIAILVADLATNCLKTGCTDEGKIAIWLWLALCALCLATTPMLFRLRRQSDWLQPRPGPA